MKKILLHGTLSTVLAASAALVYLKIYNAAFMVDFSKVMPVSNIIASTLIGCLLMALGYFVLEKRGKNNWKGAMNIMYSVLSFLSIIGVLGMNLPLDMEFPEMFPGLAIPMHFFPVLAFLTVEPFFRKGT